MKFTLRKNPATGKFWFTIVSTNGSKLAHSEQYVAKAGALNAIDVIRREAAAAPTIDETATR